MLSAIKTVCKADKARKDGTSLVFIQYCFNSNKRTLLNTGICIPPQYWNIKKQFITQDLPVNYGNSAILNRSLIDQKRRVEEIVHCAISKKLPEPIDFLNKYFVQDLKIDQIEKLLLEEEARNDLNNPKKNLDIYFQIDDYISSKAKLVSPGMIKVYKNMKVRLRAFEEHRKTPITFDSLNLDFYKSLVTFLSYDYVQRRRNNLIYGLRVNSIGQTIKQLRVFVSDRVRRKIIDKIDMSEFKILEEEADAIYLSAKEIQYIYEADLSGYQHLVKYRDLFVLGCHTGLRFSDFSNLELCDIRKGMIYKKQQKSKGRVVIPLSRQAAAILQHMFSVQLPRIEMHEFNIAMKLIGEKTGINELVRFSYRKGNVMIEETKPKYAWITSHTCRRSFCTNEFLSGTPPELIMKISGHKSIKDFYRYIRITAEEAAQKLQEIWTQRETSNV